MSLTPLKLDKLWLKKKFKDGIPDYPTESFPFETKFFLGLRHPIPSPRECYFVQKPSCWGTFETAKNKKTIGVTRICENQCMVIISMGSKSPKDRVVPLRILTTEPSPGMILQVGKPTPSATMKPRSAHRVEAIQNHPSGGFESLLGGCGLIGSFLFNGWSTYPSMRETNVE